MKNRMVMFVSGVATVAMNRKENETCNCLNILARLQCCGPDVSTSLKFFKRGDARMSCCRALRATHSPQWDPHGITGRVDVERGMELHLIGGKKGPTVIELSLSRSEKVHRTGLGY
jgi:hypothetical protein